jgi:hypothetical protein
VAAAARQQKQRQGQQGVSREVQGLASRNEEGGGAEAMEDAAVRFLTPGLLQVGFCVVWVSVRGLHVILPVVDLAVTHGAANVLSCACQQTCQECTQL